MKNHIWRVRWISVWKILISCGCNGFVLGETRWRESERASERADKMCLRGCVSVKQQSAQRGTDIGIGMDCRRRNTQCYNIISELKQIYSTTMEAMLAIEFRERKTRRLILLLWRRRSWKRESDYFRRHFPIQGTLCFEILRLAVA